MSIQAATWIPWLPLIGAVLCGICAIKPQWRKLAAPICVLSLLASFAIVLGIRGSIADWDATADPGQYLATIGTWIEVGGFKAEWSYFMDPLTLTMLMVVTGIGSLIAIYASGYMKGDKGYARFFAAVALFIFSMTHLVMGDNLLVTFLGWEGVGLASYLLIGYYFQKPEAVAAANKAFIMNRIGDAGFLLGIFAIYKAFGSIQYVDILPAAQAMLGDADITLLQPGAAAAYAQASQGSNTLLLITAPFLITLGAFGKSAQLPLYTWLPDAMAGPTPVSALIHAATMVTSGIYLIARLLPIYQLSPYALPLVAVIAAVTSLIAGLIALRQTDLKKIFAYSTVSQLGYMFLGVAALAPEAGVFHLITHAFFKALLFLTAGNVMHALAGNLDIRTMSGLRKKLPITCWLMFAGCLSLAAAPFTSGFFSKEMILFNVFGYGQLHEAEGHTGPIFGTLYTWLGIMALVTAFITCSYSFRAWCQVFLGAEKYEMGDEHHADDHAHGHDPEPHEMPLWPMNIPLMLLAVGGVGIGALLNKDIASIIGHSTAVVVGADHAGEHPNLFMPFTGHDLHYSLLYFSIVIFLTALGLAFFLHASARPLRDNLAAKASALLSPLDNKFWLDEAYDSIIVTPLRLASETLRLLDTAIRYFIRGLAALPAWFGETVLKPLQSGHLQGYALGMAGGLAAILVMVIIVLNK